MNNLDSKIQKIDKLEKKVNVLLAVSILLIILLKIFDHFYTSKGLSDFDFLMAGIFMFIMFFMIPASIITALILRILKGRLIKMDVE